MKTKTAETKPAQAVAYIRVSTEEQARTGISMTTQVEQLTAYCVMRGLPLADIIQDPGVSGAKSMAKRPGGARLLAMIDGGEANNVVAWRLDRLFRNASDALATTEMWTREGVSLHLVDMGGSALDTTSPTGRMMLTMLAGFAEFERSLVVERTQGARRYNKAHLRAYSPTPFGYERDGKELVEVESEQRILVRVRQWRSRGWTFRAIAEELTERGIPTKRGGTWWPSTVKYLLENDLYNALDLLGGPA
jgi:site-specific DNA recombinase